MCANARCKRPSKESCLSTIHSLLRLMCDTTLLRAILFWQMGHDRAVSTLATTVGGERYQWDLGAFISWIKSHIIGIYLLSVRVNIFSCLYHIKWYYRYIMLKDIVKKVSWIGHHLFIIPNKVHIKDKWNQRCRNIVKSHIPWNYKKTITRQK